MPIQQTLFNTDDLINQEIAEQNAMQEVSQKNKKNTKLSPLEKEIKKFEKLLKDIQNAEAEAKVNEEKENKEHQNFINICIPELKKLAEAKYYFLIHVEKIVDQHTFKKKQQQLICAFILDYAENDIEFYEPLKELYDKYFNLSYSLLSKKEKKNVSSFMGSQQTENRTTDKEESFFDALFDEFQDWQEKEKTTATKEKKEHVNSSDFLTVKELYIDLAKALHPDLEQDENIKVEKVALMQDLSVAKQSNDLYAMLQVQQKAIYLISDVQKKKYLTMGHLRKFNALLQKKYTAVVQQKQEIIFKNYTINENGFIVKNKSITGTVKEIKKEIKQIKLTSSTINDKFDLIEFINFHHMYNEFEEDWD